MTHVLLSERIEFMKRVCADADENLRAWDATIARAILADMRDTSAIFAVSEARRAAAEAMREAAAQLAEEAMDGELIAAAIRKLPLTGEGSR